MNLEPKDQPYTTLNVDQQRELFRSLSAQRRRAEDLQNVLHPESVPAPIRDEYVDKQQANKLHAVDSSGNPNEAEREQAKQELLQALATYKREFERTKKVWKDWLKSSALEDIGILGKIVDKPITHILAASDDDIRGRVTKIINLSPNEFFSPNANESFREEMIKDFIESATKLRDAYRLIRRYNAEIPAGDVPKYAAGFN
jgi:hypothetical protein